MVNFSQMTFNPEQDLIWVYLCDSVYGLWCIFWLCFIKLQLNRAAVYSHWYCIIFSIEGSWNYSIPLGEVLYGTPWKITGCLLLFKYFVKNREESPEMLLLTCWLKGQKRHTWFCFHKWSTKLNISKMYCITPVFSMCIMCAMYNVVFSPQSPSYWHTPLVSESVQ